MSFMSVPANGLPDAVALALSRAMSRTNSSLTCGGMCFIKHMVIAPIASTMALSVAASAAGRGKSWLFSMGASFLVAVEGVRAVNGTGLGVPALFRHSHAGAHALAGQAQTGVSLPALARGLSGLAVAFFFLPIF
jgi:hypothetical protein